MKKTFLWMLTVILLCGTTALTSCKDDDDANSSEQTGSETVSIPAGETADQLGTKINGLTYVFNADYTGEGAAVVRRAVNSTQDIKDPNVQNIILNASNIAALTENDLVAISALIIRGGALVLVEPTPQDEIDLMEKILKTADDCINGTIESSLFDELDYEKLEWLYGWAIQGTKELTASYSAENFDDRSLEIVGWRGFQVYKSLNVHEGETYTKELGLTVVNEDGTTETTPLAYDETVVMNDYLFGLQADEAAAWMNTKAEEDQTKRAAAVKAIANRAGEAQQYIDKLATAQEYHLQLGGIITIKDGSKVTSRYHKVLVDRWVWAAYSFDKKTDYYCVNQTVKLYNQDLQCGPDNDQGWWWNSETWEKWKYAREVEWHGILLRSDMYGPYLKGFGFEAYVKDASPRIEQSRPVNATDGGTTVSEGISYSLGANLGFSGPNAAGGVSASISWSQSVSRVVPDVKMTAKTDPNTGHVNWQYSIDNVPKTKNAVTGANHTFAVDVAKKELQLQQAWIWSIPNSSASTIDVVTDWNMHDQWLTWYADGGPYHTSEYYIDEKFSNTDLKSQQAIQGYTFDRIQRVTCPPRFKETWSMTIEGDGITGDQKKKVEDYLVAHLSDQYVKSFVLFSYKNGHQKTVIDGKTKLETLDELGRKVAKLKADYEANGNVAEMLRNAGKDAGIPATGSYKIVWRNTDSSGSGAKYDNEELTINLTAPAKK